MWRRGLGSIRSEEKGDLGHRSFVDSSSSLDFDDSDSVVRSRVGVDHFCQRPLVG